MGYLIIIGVALIALFYPLFIASGQESRREEERENKRNSQK
jgi:hypothetical protein